MAVGAPYNYDKGYKSGSVYLFNTTDGSLIHKLTADDGANNDHFGFSVSLSDGFIAVGSNYDDTKGTDSGSVYLFKT